MGKHPVSREDNKWVLTFGPEPTWTSAFMGRAIDIIDYQGTKEQFENLPQAFHEALKPCINPTTIIFKFKN